MTERLRRDLPHVMHETIDDEVVIVNLSTGIYYSFDGVGVRLWEWIDGSRSVDDLIRLAHENFTGDEDSIADPADNPHTTIEEAEQDIPTAAGAAALGRKGPLATEADHPGLCS